MIMEQCELLESAMRYSVDDALVQSSCSGIHFAHDVTMHLNQFEPSY